MAFAYLDTIEQLWDENFWKKWYEDVNEHTVDLRRFPTDHVEVGAPPVKTPYGWLFIYSIFSIILRAIRSSVSKLSYWTFTNPRRYLAAPKGPLIVPEEIYEQYGLVRAYPSHLVPLSNLAKEARKSSTSTTAQPIPHLPERRWIWTIY